MMKVNLSYFESNPNSVKIDKFKVIFSIIFIFGCVTSRAINPYSEKKITLGNSEVSILIYENKYKLNDRMFIHVHENEVASLQAGLALVESHGGRLVTLKHSKSGVNRNIRFVYKGEKYEFDPNRIYSSNIDVVRKALKTNESNKLHVNEALNQVLELSRSIWDEIKTASYLISLHNNKNECAKCERKGWFGFRMVEPSYNIGSYVKTCDIESESSASAESIFINPKFNNSEFFIVTDEKDFAFLSEQKMNVVLQNKNPIDDGSMSVFAVKNKMRYMNAEAKHGKLTEQKQMLEIIKNLK